MKIVSSIFGFLLLVLVLCFAFSNQQDVEVKLWPMTGTLQLPLYLVGFAPLVFGFLVGGLWGWLGGIPHRLRARRLNKELGTLSGRIDELQKTAIVQSAEVARKSTLWGRKA